MTRPGGCSGCNAPATREAIDPTTKAPLGVLLCESGARAFGLYQTRRLHFTAAADQIPTATVNGGPEDSQEAFPVSPRGRGVRRSVLANAG